MGRGTLSEGDKERGAWAWRRTRKRGDGGTGKDRGIGREQGEEREDRKGERGNRRRIERERDVRTES